MARSLCLLVLMGCALHVVESRSRDARQVADDSTNLLPCKGAFVQFVGRTLIDDVRNLSLTIENDEAGSYLCIVKIKRYSLESHCVLSVSHSVTCFTVNIGVLDRWWPNLHSWQLWMLLQFLKWTFICKFCLFVLLLWADDKETHI